MGHCIFNDRGQVPPRDSALQSAHIIRLRLFSWPGQPVIALQTQMIHIVFTAGDFGRHASAIGNAVDRDIIS